jgi:hypothetical protein
MMAEKYGADAQSVAGLVIASTLLSVDHTSAHSRFLI